MCIKNLFCEINHRIMLKLYSFGSVLSRKFSVLSVLVCLL
ncbi:hypothetical protein HMPREF9193_01954 [Treponema lecithinolyticum ATCC 700332]|uniref:Uncharacterized protein n=1 Tax=Treponema lecithinolyticum ATCC 700332 TaxID=1321815 RepID=A0ABN0NWJ6_TRELE|nr:hypothetical protein HMPREF9193_01954 [Treponema lecithinolyticum ATCC 700332]